MSKNRILAVATLFACAFALQGQQNMFKIDLVPSGSMVALNEPVLQGGTYVFRAWPDGASTSLRQTRVGKITRLTGKAPDIVYQIELNPSGLMIAKDNPTLKGATYVFHAWRDGALMSVRKADVKKITPLTGDQAFWAEQGQMGEAKIGNLPMEGASKVIEIGSLAMQGGSSQAGRTNVSDLGRGGAPSGISGAPAQGNWLYQGTPGVSDAYAPANATVSDGVPTMPAATDGSAPPQ